MALTCKELRSNVDDLREISEAEKHEKCQAINKWKSVLSEKEAKLSEIEELELTLKKRDEKI